MIAWMILNAPGFAQLYYRYCCPGNSDRWARACVMSGKCGCKNADRFSLTKGKHE